MGYRADLSALPISLFADSACFDTTNATFSRLVSLKLCMQASPYGQEAGTANAGIANCIAFLQSVSSHLEVSAAPRCTRMDMIRELQIGKCGTRSFFACLLK